MILYHQLQLPFFQIFDFRINHIVQRYNDISIKQ